MKWCSIEKSQKKCWLRKMVNKQLKMQVLQFSRIESYTASQTLAFPIFSIFPRIFSNETPVSPGPYANGNFIVLQFWFLTCQLTWMPKDVIIKFLYGKMVIILKNKAFEGFYDSKKGVQLNFGQFLDLLIKRSNFCC